MALAVLKGRGRRGAAIGLSAARVTDWRVHEPRVPPAVAALVVRGWPGRAGLLATVLDLARRGHLVLGDDRLACGPGGDPLLPYEETLLEALLDRSPETTRAELAGRLPGRVAAVRTAIEAEAAARGLLAGDPRAARRRAALWFGGFGLLAVAGMAVSVALAAGSFVAGLLVAFGTARVRRTEAGEAEAGRLAALASALARAGALPPERVERLRPYAVALGVLPAEPAWLARLMEPPAPAPAAGDGGREGGDGGGGYGASGGASGGGGASRGW